MRLCVGPKSSSDVMRHCGRAACVPGLPEAESRLGKRNYSSVAAPERIIADYEHGAFAGCRVFTGRYRNNASENDNKCKFDDGNAVPLSLLD
jgi:hypothetical protein